MLFPIILAIFFRAAFSNLSTAESFETIPVAIVQSENHPDLKTTMDLVAFSEDKMMFETQTADEATAIQLLDNNEVRAIITISPAKEILLTLKYAGLSETIIKSFLDEYLQTTSAITTIMIATSGSIPIDDLLAQLQNQETHINQVGLHTANPDMMLVYFYSLIGMALMYGGFWGTNETIDLQANLSAKGLRVTVGPIKRFRLLLTNLSAAFIIHFGEILFLLFFITVILGVNLGNNLGYIILLCALGSFTGITFGAFISLLLKKAGEGTKTAFTILIGIVGGFLSGMMYANIKYYVLTTFPLLAWINPVHLMSDALFSLYYFPTLDRYIFNLILLVVLLIIFLVGTLLCFRRDDYESI
jgi:ABC-2 type transport system permease protein